MTEVLQTDTALSSRRSKKTVSASVNNRATLDIPLDFSFYSLSSLEDLKSEEPREQLGKKAPKSDEKYLTKSLKLNNNALTELSGLDEVCKEIVFDPSLISWLDLSFNELGKIDPVLCGFESLQILYLHGNQITEINEVDKLSQIKSLKKLALHGNPIENVKNYRWYVLSKVPQLINLDMSAVTKTDRVMAKTCCREATTRRQKRSSNYDDERD